MEGLEKEDPEALAEWAFWSRNGWGGVQNDHDLIFERASRSAGAGNAYGMAILSRCYGRGEGVAINNAKALEFAEMAVAAGHPLGLKNLANCYKEPQAEGHPDIKKSRALERKAAAEGSINAKTNEMLSVLLGLNGGTKNEKKGLQMAVNLLKEHQCLGSAVQLAYKYYNTPNLPLFDEEVVRLMYERLESASQCGLPRPMVILGRQYCVDGRGRVGVPMIIQAARMDDSYAKRIMLMVAEGDRLGRKAGAVGSWTTIFRLAREANRDGDTTSTVLRRVVDSYLFSSGMGKAREADKALPYLKILVERGDVKARSQFGMVYYSPKKNPAYDKRRGVAHFEYAEWNSVNMLHGLGVSYLNGVEEDRDYIKAFAVFTYLKNKREGGPAKKIAKSLKNAADKLSPEDRIAAEDLIRRGYPLAEEFQREAIKVLKEYGDIPLDTEYRPKK